jgi:hypothetical protein
MRKYRLWFAAFLTPARVVLNDLLVNEALGSLRKTTETRHERSRISRPEPLLHGLSLDFTPLVRSFYRLKVYFYKRVRLHPCSIYDSL